MEKLFPERPALLFDFVLPSRSKDFFLNLWIADPHGANSYVCCFRNPNGIRKINPCIRGRESSYGRGRLHPALHVSTLPLPRASGGKSAHRADGATVADRPLRLQLRKGYHSLHLVRVGAL